MAKLPPHIQEKIEKYLQEKRNKQQNLTDSPKLFSTQNTHFILNDKQKQAVEYALKNVSFVLTGAAGTGKTTTTRAIAESLLQKSTISRVSISTKNLQEGQPGIFFLAFTRAAVRNLRKVLPEELHSHCFTIHKFVEMRPEEILKVDENGKEYVTKVYKPYRNQFNPLPAGIQTIIFDESSMISETHYKWVCEAIPYDFQEIFIGDINQLPTVADYSIFPQKLTTLPVIELTHIYRQALESPIIRLAHRIKNGQAPTHEELLANPDEYKSKNLAIHRFQHSIGDDDIACMKYCNVVKKLYQTNQYDPYNDIILLPWEKRFGWKEVNRWIATFIDEQLQEQNNLPPIYEIFSMMRKEYLRVGDKVFYDKNPAIIREISLNALYVGNQPRLPSTNLTRWGTLGTKEHATETIEDEESYDDIEFLLAQDIDKLSRQCSHVITIQFEDGETEKISTNQEFSLLSLGYATTVHKAQGGQWPHVILMLHKSHNISINRELLYTACTRAQERLTIICEKDTLEKRAKAQAIKGDTIEEKIEWYRIKLKERAERAARESVAKMQHLDGLLDAL